MKSTNIKASELFSNQPLRLITCFSDKVDFVNLLIVLLQVRYDFFIQEQIFIKKMNPERPKRPKSFD